MLNGHPTAPVQPLFTSNTMPTAAQAQWQTQRSFTAPPPQQVLTLLPETVMFSAVGLHTAATRLNGARRQLMQALFPTNG